MNTYTKLIRVLCLCLSILLLAGCGAKPSPEAAHATEPQETTAPQQTTAQETTVPEETIAVVEYEDHLIPTPYVDLHFPGEWASFLQTQTEEGMPYTVTFYAVLDNRQEPQELFAIQLDGDPGNAIGAVKGSDGQYAAVNAESFAFEPDDTWNDRDINIVYTMQEAMNYVLSNMVLEDISVMIPDETTAEPAPTESDGNNPGTSQPGAAVDPDDMAIDTPYVVLHYPSAWADYLTINVDDGTSYGVTYGGSVGDHPDMNLFTVWFGGDKGASLKTIKAASGEMVEIRIEVFPLELDGTWSEEERSILYAMQEDLNYLLAKLS